MSTKAKVLIIDDDPIVLEVVRERLEAAGYEGVTRQEALGTTQVVRDERPDVVLLDIMMPALNGERIATLLKANDKTVDVAIVLHSSKSHAELLPLIEQTGAVGAISKTESEADFMRRFGELVRRHMDARA